MSSISLRAQARLAPRLSRAACWVLAAVLITNIGNGMHTIIVSKLLYDRTGSAAAFGVVIVAEYIINSLFQVFAGSVVDRGVPQRVCIWCDAIRGLFVCCASFLVFSSYGQWWILASILVINIAKPFYRSATFALGPAVAQGDMLTRFNARSTSFLQVGQLLGVALVGLVIQRFGANVAFALDGLSYLGSALAIAASRAPLVEARLQAGAASWTGKVVDDWKEILVLLRSNFAMTCHVVLSTGDFLVVSLVNLSLVPMVNTWYGGNIYWVSALDGGYAVGVMVGASIAVAVLPRVGLRNAAVAGLGGEALLFVVLAAIHTPYVAVAAMNGIGIMSATSFSAFLSSLQRRSHGPIKGRIAGLRYMILTAVAGVLIPVIAHVQNVSMERGLLAAAMVCAAYSVTTFVLSGKRVLGDALLGLGD